MRLNTFWFGLRIIYKIVKVDVFFMNIISLPGITAYMMNQRIIQWNDSLEFGNGKRLGGIR
jgi:hypothetical protein